MFLLEKAVLRSHFLHRTPQLSGWDRRIERECAFLFLLRGQAPFHLEVRQHSKYTLLSTSNKEQFTCHRQTFLARDSLVLTRSMLEYTPENLKH